MQPQALVNLDERLAEIKILVSLAKARKTRRTKNHSHELPAILRGAIVLLSSHMEGFFEDLVQQIVSELDSGVTNTSKLPKALRMRQVFGDDRRWQTDNIDKRWDLLRNTTNSPLLRDDADHVPGGLDLTLHIAKFSNPGTTEVKALFKTVGLEDCWNSFKDIEPRGAYKSEVDSIVSRRNQIAHGDMNASITEADLDQYSRNFRHTASVFCHLSEKHISSFIQNFRWLPTE